MNVTFRLPSEELEKKFVKEATAAGLDGLKGHRSVGGMRASIYNAFPEAGVDALVAVHAGIRAQERLSASWPVSRTVRAAYERSALGLTEVLQTAPRASCYCDAVTFHSRSHR